MSLSKDIIKENESRKKDKQINYYYVCKEVKEDQ
jgi:hypothetical protein